MLCKRCFSALQRKELSAPIYWLSAGNLLVLCFTVHLPRAPSGQRLQVSWRDGSCRLSDPCTREHFCALIDGELDAASKIFAAYSFRNHWFVAPQESKGRKGSFGCRSFPRERNSSASTLERLLKTSTGDLSPGYPEGLHDPGDHLPSLVSWHRKKRNGTIFFIFF